MPPPHDIEAEVRDTVHAFLRTGALPGAESIDASLAYLAADFTGIGTGQSDYYPDPATFGALLRREKEQGPYPGAYEAVWMYVRELRPGLALAEGQIRFEIDAGGETHVVEPRCSFVLERRGSRWLIAHFHFSFADAMQAEGDSLMDALENRTRELERLVAERTAELEAAQAQLVQREKLASLGRLTAGIAHEIKNPLNFVSNFAGLSQELVDELEGTTDPEERQVLLTDLKANAAKIEEHSRRADAIVRQMMDHSRSGSGERRAVDLNALVAEYANLAYHGMRARHPGVQIAFTQDLGDGVGQADVVAQEIGRVLINLLDNAFDAVRQRAAESDGAYSPTVRIATQRTEDGRVAIRVEDNGPGIPEAIRSQVFDPFFTTKPTGEGTGLGLSMSYDIVTHGHRGSLTVESAEGEGSVFRLLLPAS